MGRKIKPLAAKYGKLKVIGIDHTEKNKVYVRCVCDCGTEKLFLKSNLMSGKSTSCGCQRGKRKPKNVAPAVEVEPKVRIIEPQLTLDDLVVELKDKTATKNDKRKIDNDNFELTEENYYSTIANRLYVSASQYGDFFGKRLGISRGCEYQAMAKINGLIQETPTTAMLIGSYVDAYFEGTLEQFKANHPEIISTRGATAGELKADFKKADVMIKRAEEDKLFMKFMAGDKQVIMTGEIEGVKCKIKIDSTDGIRITDLKTVRNMSETFYVKDSGERVNFIEWWQYDRQLALYREIYRQNTGDVLPCYIAAISKDETNGVPHPRLAVIEIPPMLMDERLVEIKQNITHIQDLKDGLFDPIACNCCDYCADTLPLERIITPDELLTEV